MFEHKIFGLTIKQWLFLSFLSILCTLSIVMITAYYHNLEKTIIENETDVKWLRKANDSLRHSIETIEKTIVVNSKSIDDLMFRSKELETENKKIIDSVKKLKLRYNENRNRFDTIDIDGIRRYFSEIPEIPKN